MVKPLKWSVIAEIVGTVAVVISLLYVGPQVRQNTAAIHASTSSAIYQQHQDLYSMMVQNPEVADLVLRMSRDSADATSIDAFRYSYFLNLRLNLLEAVFTQADRGTMDPELARGWLVTMSSCVRGARTYWEENGSEYHAAFRAAMDSALASKTCEAP